MNGEYREFWATLVYGAVGFALMAAALLTITEVLAPGLPEWVGGVMGLVGGAVVIFTAIRLGARNHG